MQSAGRSNLLVLSFCLGLLMSQTISAASQPLDQILNQAIRSIFTPPQPPPPAAQVQQRHQQGREHKAPKAPSQDVAQAQSLLNSLGYDAGPVDGVFGRRTRQAMNRFQRDSGHQPTTTVTDQVLQALNQSYLFGAQNGVRQEATVPDVAPPLVTQSPSLTATDQATSNVGMEKLLSPPSGITPLDITKIEGVPVFTSRSLPRLVDLIALGYNPDLLTQNECNLIAALFTDQLRKQYMGGSTCETGIRWHGNDEFARGDMRTRFYTVEVPKLLTILPKLPITIALVDNIKVGQFEAETSSFQLRPNAGLLELLTTIWAGARLGGSALQPWPTLALSGALPAMQLRMDAEQARDFIAEVNSWSFTPDYGGPPSTNQRMMKRLAVVELSALDPETNRLDIRLKSVSLRDLALSRTYHNFPIEAAPGSVVSDGTADNLVVPQPVELDTTYLLLRQIQQLDPSPPDEIWEALANLIADRDKGYYEELRRDPARSLSLGARDVRRPFFAAGDYAVPETRWPIFQQWVKSYTAGLPDLVEYGRDVYSDFNAKEIHQLTALPGSPPSVTGLSELNIQPDQVLQTGGVLIVLPNASRFYSMDVAGEKLKPYESKTLRLRMLFSNQPKTHTILKGDQQFVLIHLDPVSLTLTDGDEIIATRSFDDVPRLEDGFVDAGVRESNEAPLFDVARPISNDLINLLLAGNLDPADARYARLIVQRWYLEQQGFKPGGQFFLSGKRVPTESEARELAGQFSGWAKKLVPALPAEVRLIAALDLRERSFPEALSWEALECFSLPLTQQDAIRIASNQRMNGGEKVHREQAIAGMGQWTQDDEVRVTARELEPLASRFVTQFGCSQNNSEAERNPLPVYAVLPGLFPHPPKGALSAEVRLKLNSMSYIEEAPQYLDLLPPDMQKFLVQELDHVPGEYVKLDAELAEVVYRNGPGTELARYNPDPAFSLDELLSRFWDVVEETDPSDSGEPYGPDIIGIRLGMTFADAEAIIREHMQVGLVLDGIRAWDDSIEKGAIRPATSGKLFVSVDGREFIALLDEAPAVKDVVLAAWRRFYLAPNELQEGDAIATLTEKYGPPSMTGNVQVGIRNFWATPLGHGCGSNYVYGGQRPMVASSWSDGSGQMQFILPDGRPIPDAVLPTSMLDPTNPGNHSWLNCGPVFTAELSFDASRTAKAGFPTQERDWIEQIITDVGPYIEAYKANRQNLASGERALGSAPKAQVRF